ncbi:O-antigen polymerase [Acinetobacter baumannii]|uniref:O-antigen polymerase n=1 Tax=Acinetobacter baumannii TaxID=470 RepID=UPI000DE60C9C|nr:O-antigen polymerase [Acinetobacter baumannii]UEH20335.1 Wzy [Acinetobacter baumannii]SSQ10401.1 Uncharacterised protein [Acinetobacter baumannii]
MIYVLIAILFLFFLIAIIYEFKKNGFTVVFMSLVWMFVIYCISPLMLLISYDEVVSARFIGNFYDLNSIIPIIIIFIFLGVFLLGSKVSLGTKKYIYLEKTNDTRIAFSLWVIGVLSLSFYIYSYGGLTYFLQNMSQIRSGTADVKNYFAAFIFSFAKYLNLAFLIIFIKFLKKEFYDLKQYVLLIVILISCFFSLYLSAGREDAISFIVSGLAAYYFVKRKIPLISGILVGLFSIFYIVFGKTFLFAMNNEDFDTQDFIENKMFDDLENSFNLVIYEFTHQYLSLVNFLQNEFSFRYFGDYLYWIFKPFKLLGLDIPDSISYYNTYLVYGVWDSEIPPGAVAFGYISGGVFGVIVHAFILGIIIGAFDRFFNPKKQNNTTLLAYYAFMVSSLTYLISNSDPALFLQNRLPHFLFIVFIMFIYKVKFKNR